MNKSKFWSELALFVIALIAILTVRAYVSQLLIERGIDSYQTHTFVSIVADLLLILISYFLIKRNRLTSIAGLKGTKIEKANLLLIPFVYLVLLNALLLDDVHTDLLIQNIPILIINCLFIGLAEELSIRGFLQSHLIKTFGTTKKNVVLSVFASALFFGLLHVLKFDKGIYGELSQVCFATFIGVLFGFLLLVTKRIYPLILMHTIIDFVAKLDSTGVPIKEKISESMSFENSVFIVLLALPCLIYGIYLMKKIKVTDQTVQY